MKPVAPARRPAEVEDGVRVDRGMRPCAEWMPVLARPADM